MTKIMFTGNTYGIKETLKSLGFKWDPIRKAWIGSVCDNEAEHLMHRWYSEGVYAERL